MNDNFGFNIGLDGDNLVVGAYLEDEDEFGGATKANAGALYMFERNGAGVWVDGQKMVCSDRDIGFQLGYSVAIEGTRMSGVLGITDIGREAFVMRMNSSSGEYKSPVFDDGAKSNEPSTWGFKLYPNPTNGIVSLEMEGKDIETGYKVEIINMQGQVIYSDLNNAIITTIDLSAFDRGVYMARVITTKGTKMQRLILQ